ncbi:antibiotic biosynthesis monooxygenase [Rhodococcus fascians]|nr:antibiotic biosynthesis monooxygenase [Rhodococcus fascians]MBY4114603.1 antibiotic biosynthesis monooxygenase [Rhodococcus fascians]
MIAEHVEIEVRPGREAELESSFETVRTLLLGAPGCTEARLHASVDRPGTYLLVAHWNRLDDHTVVFAASDAGARVREVLEPLCAGPPRVIHYQL